MDYQRVYDQIVQRAKTNSRVRSGEVYYESHHILPKCMGGTDEEDNLVLLTAREHFICHWLLVRLYPNNYKLMHAFWMMCNTEGKGQSRYTPSSITYQEAKEHKSKLGHSEETKKLIGYYSSQRVHTQDAKDRIRQTTILNNSKLTSEEKSLKYGNPNEKNPRSRKIVQMDLDGNFIRVFPSINEAIRQGFTGDIQVVVSGRGKTAGGFKYKYYEEYYD